ncbi:MAG: cupin domain-containing protein [Solirubrobacteraceae bacterium]|jgi:mannose-6-phosphate isomerase-like protein (cupin superfamily)
MSGLVRDCADAPERRIGNDATAVREVIGSADGCDLFTLRVLRTVAGRSFERSSGETDELLFVVAGSGQLITADGEHQLEPETGALVAGGQRYEIDNVGPADLLIVAVSLHDPLAADGDGEARTQVSRVADQAAQTATADREFRIVFDPDNGCGSATQFVGYIPVGAAPAHYHLYDEVIYVLEGEGVMHMNASQTPLRAGSCIHLPARKLHTLANSGPGVMRVLGVFRPAGSPAAAFYPDGTPASYIASEPKTASLST